MRTPDALSNLGPGERRKRLLVGIVALAVAIGGYLWMRQSGADRGMRLLLFLPLLPAALGFLQAGAKT